ncbi:serine acetyltransferase [Actinomycetes bacterium M1A6_2h]
MAKPSALTLQLALARVWAYPLWRAVHRADPATMTVDVETWVERIERTDITELSRYSQFAYLSGALPEFRTLVHYRLRPLPLLLRAALRLLYKPERTLVLEADTIGPGLFIQHGTGSIVTAVSIGSNCWLNQMLAVGYNAKGRPTIGNNVRIGVGAVVIGPITIHDGATIGANATVMSDVAAGVTMVSPLAIPMTPRGIKP